MDLMCPNKFDEIADNVNVTDGGSHRRAMKAVVEEEEDEEEADVHVDDACPGRQCMQCMHMFSVQGHSFPTPHQVATAPSTIIIHLSSSVYP
ncbi:unnamed protein product [Onchocerca ochengi]|uniref:Q_MOTIF domain-containing protein n=1 Tax=Onchocerca ochengi TaxID=42157 RepID=A0A182E8V0_ONCOC|nr:unnamed protein product [Onchocerca ochengi]